MCCSFEDEKTFDQHQKEQLSNLLLQFVHDVADAHNNVANKC